MELSGTGVPPSVLAEVQERRSGAYRSGGTALRLVPAEIKHWLWGNETLKASDREPQKEPQEKNCPSVVN